MQVLNRLCEWVCVIQMPIFLLLWSLGYERKGIIMRLVYHNAEFFEYPIKINDNNNSTGSEFEQTLHAYLVTRNRESLLLFILCTCFAIIYMVLAKLNTESYDILETAVDNTECSLSASSIETHSEIKNFLYASKSCFWLYQCVYYYVFLCVCLGSLHSSKLVTENTIFLYALTKTLCIWICCKTDQYLKRKMFFIFSVLILYIGITYLTTYWYLSAIITHDISSSFQTQMFSICIFQTLLEVILILGHQGDTETTFMTSLNCRLFYVTLSSVVMQLLVSVDPTN